MNRWTIFFTLMLVVMGFYTIANALHGTTKIELIMASMVMFLQAGLACATWKDKS